MIRNLKVLGLALASMLAIGAFGASAASAATDVFTSGTEKAWATGTSHDNLFEITKEELWVECTTSQFTATIEDEATEATALAEYTGRLNQTPHGVNCDSAAGQVEVDMNDCHYVLTGDTSREDSPPSGKDAVIWIQCEENKPIEITTELGVSLTINSQTPTVGGVSYKNLPEHSGGDAVEVNATVTGITWSCHPTFLCTLGGIRHHGQDADYNGSVTVTGWNDLGGTMTEPSEGARTDIGFHEVP